MDSAKVAQALKVIANERGEYSLQKAAASVESGTTEYTMDLDEAYTRLQIPNRLSSDDVVLQYYQSLSTGAAVGSKDSFDQALRTIAHARESHFLLRKLEDPDADVKADPGQADQPVGLENIGNTCYLNSLLQYFYIIRSVRELVLNINDHRMPLSDSEVSNRRAGGRTNTKAEVIKGLKCK
jgi:ubiquitin carboxyl-terminal hydrolase 25